MVFLAFYGPQRVLLRGIERARVRDVTEAARRVHLDTVYLLKD